MCTYVWDERYRAASDIPAAAEVLSDNRHLLPASGKTLDLACGLGGNALLLARAGLATWAWDSSAVAIEKLRTQAAEHDLVLSAEVRDVIADPPLADSFDVIVVSRFLERSLAPALVAALRPAGLLFYQTFTALKVDSSGPSNPAYLLDDNELLRLFADLRLRVYREEGQLGDVRCGVRNTALLVAEKI